ncbi:hypothetical protein Pla108_33370 [Botrimarina colliarenosi]|uniref:Ysc84 actin-binding domain-containing protein n=1 Tax=Botrimarina colliarenosi TaxID=2528001 RepID=A0A5C6A5H3_9BACT|nr:lipid-binding SYLF domain-containing protein [Botrimarina colliarenosi]TWT95194.1 hypothetical protein Pla108_33370 [Botrimarina colliarenosi]
MNLLRLRVATVVASLPLAFLVVATPTTAQAPPMPVAASAEEDRIVVDATTVFDEMLAAPGTAIPRSMLAGAEGVVIVPRVVKGGFIVGARYGRGVVVARDAQGVWRAPLFVTITGGNIGWQAGVQATDLVLVYRSQRGVDSLMAGKLTLGADIAAAAGPVGREAGAATDTSLTAEVYSYSRSRGLFAGVSLDGSVLKIDHAATAAYYRPPAGYTPVQPGTPYIPEGAQRLAAKVVEQTAPATALPAPEPSGGQPGIGAPNALDDAASTRDQLADFAPRLYRLLDPAWQGYLSLPAEVFQEAGHPSPEVLTAAVGRFEAVAADPRYTNLAALPEFQTTRGLLRHYAQVLANTPRTLALPPPPQ